MEELNKIRVDIDKIDNEIVDLLAKRMEMTKKVKKIKYENHIMYFDRGRYAEILDRVSKRGLYEGLSPDYVRQIFNLIHKESLDKIIGSCSD